MFNSVQLVRDLCKDRNIPIAKLEKDCGFSNGYLNPKKMSRISYDRAVVIAEYLGVSADLILTGEENKKELTVSGEPVIDMSDVDFAFYGGYKELSEDDQKVIRDMVQLMRERRATKQDKEKR